MKCQKNWKQRAEFWKAKKEKLIILSKCAVRVVKKHEASRLLSNLGIRTPLGKSPKLGDI